MSIAAEIRELKPATQDFRKFGWTVGTAFLILAAVFAFFGYRESGEWSFSPVLLAIGGALIVLGTIVPRLLKPVYWGWMAFAVVLGFVMTRLILSVFFFLVLLPVGLVFKLIGRDALHRKIDRQAATYWIDKEYAIDDRSRLEKFF